MGIMAIPIPIQVVSHSFPFTFPILSPIPIPMGIPWELPPDYQITDSVTIKHNYDKMHG